MISATDLVPRLDRASRLVQGSLAITDETKAKVQVQALTYSAFLTDVVEGHRDPTTTDNQEMLELISSFCDEIAAQLPG